MKRDDRNKRKNQNKIKYILICQGTLHVLTDECDSALWMTLAFGKR